MSSKMINFAPVKMISMIYYAKRKNTKSTIGTGCKRCKPALAGEISFFTFNIKRQSINTIKTSCFQTDGSSWRWGGSGWRLGE
jgi:hypothetical protein